MDKNFSREFKQCPVCELYNIILDLLPEMSEKHKRRQPLPFFSELAKELKDRGIARPEWNFAYDTKTGAVTDPAKVQAIPIGSELPAYDIATDICMECGCVYATKLRRIQAHRSIDQPKQPLLGKRIMGINPNNPRLS